MKKTIYYFILQCIVSCFVIQAQQRPIYIIPKNFTINEGMIEIELLFDMKFIHMRSVESITYTPIIVAGNGQHELPQLIIKGSSRYKADRRVEVLTNSPVATMFNQAGNGNASIYSIEKYNKKNFIRYRVSVPYKEWMSLATVNLREEVFGCCNEAGLVTLRTHIFEEYTADGNVIQPKFNYLVPDREFEKNRNDIGNAYLEFAQGSSVINPSFRNNQKELDKINQMIITLMEDPDIRVTSIEMRGYASPEGSASSNLELSSQRAKAMREYFVRKNIIAPGSILLGIGGEDWEGLKNLLFNYPVTFKEEIFYIINSVQDLDLREQRIRNLGNGEPYRQIFRDLYPQLRRVDCQINYTARSFTIEEGIVRLQGRPKLLSQNEMYQIAQTYPEGSAEFNRTLITARQYFPENDIANLNGAAAALLEGDPDSAEVFLKQVKNTNLPEYANCMGVLNLFRGNYIAAEDFLLKAHAGGVEEAAHNLRELQRRRNR